MLWEHNSTLIDNDQQPEGGKEGEAKGEEEEESSKTMQELKRSYMETLQLRKLTNQKLKVKKKVRFSNQNQSVSAPIVENAELPEAEERLKNSQQQQINTSGSTGDTSPNQSKENMTSHANASKKPRNCTYCGKEFPHYVNMVRHRTMAHPDQYKVDRAKLAKEEGSKYLLKKAHSSVRGVYTRNKYKQQLAVPITTKPGRPRKTNGVRSEEEWNDLRRRNNERAKKYRMIKDSKAKAYETEVPKLYEENESLWQENNRLKTEAEAIPLGRMKELRREIEKLPKELLKLREENESMKALMDKLPQILEKHKFGAPQYEVPKIQQENERLKEENEKLRFQVESLSQVKEENISLREEIERMECERLEKLKSKILPPSVSKKSNSKKSIATKQMQ